MEYILRSLWGIALASTLLAKESPVLRLDVYVVEQATEIHSFVTNVSGTAITIPTTTDGTEAMSWSITGGPRSTFGFSIGAHEIEATSLRSN
jgi:hypothetical protein